MDLKKRFPIFEAVLVTVILIVHVYAALSDAYNLPNAWFIRDDAYYYFKVAQNISEGHGSTFDGINLTNGYHPLWMLVCIPIFALARFDLILPLRILLILTAVLNAATAVLIYRLVRRALSTPVAMLAASFWAFNEYIHYTVYEFGLETPLAAFTVVWLLDQLSSFESEWRTGLTTRKRIASIAVIATLVMFSRLDLVFFAVIIGIWLILRGHPARFLMPLDIAVIFFSMVTAFALRTGFPAYYVYMDTVLVSVILGLFMKIAALYFWGSYSHPRPASLLRVLGKTALAVTSSTVILSAVLILLDTVDMLPGFPRSILLYDWGISLGLMLVLRLAAWSFGKRSTGFNPQSPLVELKSKWRGWFEEGAVYYGILGGALALYMLWNMLAFGTSTPVSGQIKRWWGSMLQSIYGSPATKWQDFLGLGNNNDFAVWRPAAFYVQIWSERMRPIIPGTDKVDERFLFAFTAVCVIAVVILLFSYRRTLRPVTNMALIPLMAGTGIHVLSYTTLDYAGLKEWYWITQLLLIVFMGSLLIHLVLHPITRYKRGYIIMYFASVAFSVYMAVGLTGVVIQKMPYNYFAADRPYMEVLPFIEEATPPGSIIGMTGGGNVGYFIHDRIIVNMDGLINSYDYFQSLQNGEAAVYLKQRGMDIVFASPGLLKLAPYNGQFAPYMLSFGEYGGKDFLYLLEEPKY